MSGRFADNPDYLAYEQSLILLHGLAEAGQDESEEAELIRGKMDGYWRGLNTEECDRLGGVSADLYMLQNEEILEPPAVPTESPERRIAEVEAARLQNCPDCVLSLLRRGPAFLSDRHVAALRAWAYDALGDTDVARLFAEYARKLTYLAGRRFKTVHLNFAA